MDVDLAIKLCRLTRRDSRGLLTALERKSFYDLGHEIGQSAIGGLAFKDLPSELVRLEQLITMDNYPEIRKRAWSVFDLVNYYDRLIDMVKVKELDEDRRPAIVNSLLRWRENASQLAQVVCQIEDAEST